MIKSILYMPRPPRSQFPPAFHTNRPVLSVQIGARLVLLTNNSTCCKPVISVPYQRSEEGPQKFTLSVRLSVCHRFFFLSFLFCFFFFLYLFFQLYSGGPEFDSQTSQFIFWNFVLAVSRAPSHPQLKSGPGTQPTLFLSLINECYSSIPQLCTSNKRIREYWPLMDGEYMYLRK